jgi:hypothetical protein
VLPSIPLTVTWVELVAVTVKVDEFPAVMDVGFAVMLTVGAAGGTTVTIVVAVAFPPVPVAVAV